MKKILSILILALLILPSLTFAHPGNTDSSGCHTCRTNCSSWGLSTGEYHCHNNKGFTQPEYPIHSTYGLYGTGYTTPAPDYAYPSYKTTSSCPLNSYSNGSSCTCNSGYIASGSSCVNANLYCSGKIGLMSQYNSLSKTCECMSGYKFDSSGQCVSQQSYCSSTFGYGAEYSYLKSECVCRSGYVVNSTTNKCELDTSSYTAPVIKSCPSNSYPIGSSCYCSTGFLMNSERTACVVPMVQTDKQNNTSTLLPGCSSSQGFSVTTGTPCSSQTQNYNNPIFNRTLQTSSEGEDVKLLQQGLVKLGYLPSTHQPITYFGNMTKNAVIKFQKDNVIKPAVGTFGPTTQKVFNEKLNK